jgi:hypothetical protein
VNSPAYIFLDSLTRWTNIFIAILVMNFSIDALHVAYKMVNDDDPVKLLLINIGMAGIIMWYFIIFILP